MKRLIISLFASLFIISSLQVQAQDKKELSLRSNIYPKRISGLEWIANSGFYSFIEGKKIMKQKPKAKSPVKVVSFKEIAKSLEGNEEIADFKGFYSYEWLNEKELFFTYKNHLISYNIETEKASILNSYPKESEGMEYAKNYYCAYTIENNLYITIDGKQTAVTNDKDKNIVNGQTVHRSEFGIVDGIFWSPKGNLLAFYKKDESKVADYPLINLESRIASVEYTKYPMAGESSEYVQVCIYNPKTEKTIALKSGKRDDHYLTNVTWSPDESKIYIAELNRGQNHMKLNVYDASNGDFIKTLFEEKNEKYVEPEHGPIFLDEKGDQFLWYSERDNWNHLYLYKSNGELVKQITKGEWIVTEFIGSDDTNIYVTTTENSPIENHLYKINLTDGTKKQLTKERGTHYINFCPNKEFFIDNFNSTVIANEYRVYSKEGKKKAVLMKSDDYMQNFNIGETSIFTIKGENNTDLYCRLIKPANFDPNKKYPVLVYVYGGPHAQMITNSWTAGAGMWLNYMASQGYVIWTLDNRGSANRGFEFESAIHRNVGTVEVEDQMKGVEWLLKQNWVDKDRIGVDGWSYGGFMSISLKLQHPEVFKVACAGGPVIDWKYYEVMYGERYMDTPEENPKGYENASLIKQAKDLDGRLMIIHCTKDPTVVWQQSQLFVKECVKKQKLVDYMIYPGHGHNVGGYDRLHLYKKITQYFNDFL